MRGTVAIRFPESTAARLGEALLGPDHREALRVSALQEVANILASHLIGAVGTLLTLELRPSVPVLVPRDGSIALEAVSAVRRGTGQAVVAPVLSEPEIAQPLFMTWDERGRLWVMEYRQYPDIAGLKMVSRDVYLRSGTLISQKGTMVKRLEAD